MRFSIYKKGAVLILYALVCFSSGKSISAQVMFRIPEQVKSFTNYSMPESCIALGDRLKKQFAPMKDSTFVIRNILAEDKLDTTPVGVREQLAECGAKFRTLKVPSDTVYSENMDGQIADALLLAWAARDTQWFLSVIDSDLSRYTSDSLQAISRVMARVTGAMFSFLPAPVKPDDFGLWDSLYNSIVVSRYANHSGDLKVFAGLINALAIKASRLGLYNSPDAHRVYRDIVSKVDSIGGSDLTHDKDVNHPLRESVHTIKWAKKQSLLKLWGDSLLDTLRQGGPGRYIDALVRIEHIAGFKDAVLPQTKGIGREMKGLPGTVVYKDKKFLLPDNSSYKDLTNDVIYSYSQVEPYVIVYMESMCNTKANMIGVKRDILQAPPIGVNACMQLMEALKWINKTYPDIKIVLWTPFRGQVGPMLTETPAKEAREFVKALNRTYSVSSDIVLYNTEFYNMPDSLDRRRADLSIEFLQWLLEVSPKMYEREPSFLVVAPDGRIIENTWGSSLKALKAMMEWYRNSSNLVGLGKRD